MILSGGGGHTLTDMRCWLWVKLQRDAVIDIVLEDTLELHVDLCLSILVMIVAVFFVFSDD